MLVPGFFTLPPMDRDEPRFAQASKQMLETSDFVAIRFGDEARNKKPVGIHWLQAAAVGTADLLDVPNARQQIWLYRVPSLLGAVLTVLLTYWAALPLVAPRSAVLAAVLVAATPLLGVEARLATTDAVLAATVTAVMGALVRVYLADEAARRRLFGNAIVFWAALGIGILIKGPINPLIPGLAAVVLSVQRRSAHWLRALRPLPGLVLCLLIVLPWFVLILLKTQGTFFTDAVGHDFLGKVAGGQEMHGAPPGFYLATFWLTAWPLAPFVALAVPSLWRSWRDPKIAFLLAWCIPFWLILEGVVTKLVHYALPLYPALAILAVLGVERATRAGRNYRPASGWALFTLLALVPTVVLALDLRWTRSTLGSRPGADRRCGARHGGRGLARLEGASGFAGAASQGRDAGRQPWPRCRSTSSSTGGCCSRAWRRASPYRRASCRTPRRISDRPVLIRPMRPWEAGNPASCSRPTTNC